MFTHADHLLGIAYRVGDLHQREFLPLAVIHPLAGRAAFANEAIKLADDFRCAFFWIGVAVHVRCRMFPVPDHAAIWLATG